MSFLSRRLISSSLTGIRGLSSRTTAVLAVSSRSMGGAPQSHAAHPSNTTTPDGTPRKYVNGFLFGEM
eukprot:Awhi_evm1s685